ncbi:MAG: type II secretion system F family protein [Candidatus Hydrogenedentota bacterium]
MQIVLAIIFVLCLVVAGVTLFIGRTALEEEGKKDIFSLIKTIILRIGENKAKKRLRELKTYSGAVAGESKKGVKDELDEPFYDRVIKPILQAMEKKMSGKEKAEKDRELADLLVMAGNPGNLTPGQFKALRILLIVVIFAFGMFFCLILRLNPRFILIASVAPAGFGWVMPMFVLKSKVKKRQKAIKRALPDCLDLLTVSVEAGLGFDQAVQKVIEKAKNALTDEFNRALQEVKMGKQRRDALRDMSKRVKVDELDTFISSIIQADSLGVSISNVLRIQSEQMRVKRRQQIEEQAMKAPLKMLFPMILFIFPTIFIVVFGPIGIYVYKQLSKYGMM